MKVLEPNVHACNLKIDDMRISFLCKHYGNATEQRKCFGFEKCEEGLCAHNMMFSCQNLEVHIWATDELQNKLSSVISVLKNRWKRSK